jgi:hypothetical protein
MRSGPAGSCLDTRRGTNLSQHLGSAVALSGLSRRLEFAVRGVGFFGHLLQQLKELRLLSDE